MNVVDPVLVRGLAAIAPYLDQVVVAGGWVPHIYELLYDATKAGRSPRTRDIDLAVPRSIAVKDASIDQLLQAAGFACRFHSLDTPAVTKYVASDGDDNGEIEIEFITDAPGARGAVLNVQSGLTAQELHYVGMLLENPWPVDFANITDGAFVQTVLVPTPGAFVLHKALVFKNRLDQLKKEKDLYYVFFVLDTFTDWRPLIEAQLGQLVVEKNAWFRKAIKNLEVIFESPDAAGVDALLRQRPPTAYSGLTDDQFRQYAFSVMSGLVGMMVAL